MAVAYDAIAQSVTNNNQNPSWTHTPVGTPTAALVVISKIRPGTVSSVTYGGTGMTLIDSVANGTSAVMYFYGLANPASGAQTVQINCSGTNILIGAFSYTFTGTDTTTPFNGWQEDFADAAASAADTLTVTSQSGDLVVDMVHVHLSTGSDLAMAPGADQTERDEAVYAVNNEQNYATSTQAGAASVAMDYSWGTSTNVAGWLYGAVNVVQAAAGGGTVEVPRRFGFQKGRRRLGARRAA
jgi:hypothetical protein